MPDRAIGMEDSNFLSKCKIVVYDSENATIVIDIAKNNSELAGNPDVRKKCVPLSSLTTKPIIRTTLANIDDAASNTPPGFTKGIVDRKSLFSTARLAIHTYYQECSIKGRWWSGCGAQRA
jgi:hypothetical protein